VLAVWLGLGLTILGATMTPPKPSVLVRVRG